MNKIIATIILLAVCKISLGQLKEKHTIYFDLDEDTFAISEGEELNTFFEELLYKPILDVKILGYCDDRGSKEYNMALSNRRVESVSEWLQKNNIALDHISKTVEGKGEVALQDASDDNIDDVRAKNRRVDVVFYLQEQIADQLAIKKLNKKDLTDDEVIEFDTMVFN